MKATTVNTKPEFTGLFVYVSIRDDRSITYQPHWAEWIETHCPPWTFIDLDNESDSSFLSYIQQAIKEQTHTIILVDMRSSDENASLGGIFTFLQRAARETSAQTTLFLKGEQLIIEKLGKAFHRFYQTSSQKETENQLRKILGVN